MRQHLQLPAGACEHVVFKQWNTPFNMHNHLQIFLNAHLCYRWLSAQIHVTNMLRQQPQSLTERNQLQNLRGPPVHSPTLGFALPCPHSASKKCRITACQRLKLYKRLCWRQSQLYPATQRSHVTRTRAGVNLPLSVYYHWAGTGAISNPARSRM